MSPQKICLGVPDISPARERVEGGLFEWRGQSWYRIAGHDSLPPFLTTVVSDSNLWLYAASSGGLTAGRSTPSGALFPYETVDRLFRSHGHTGPLTVLRVPDGERTWIWEPFAEDGRMRYELRRSLYKHVLGCELWFEEQNVSLGLTFRYGWRPAHKLGWVRTCELSSGRDTPRRISILDGVCNLMPAGVEKELQDAFSCLVDAYKTAENAGTGTLSLYRLTSRIVDRPEASEMLRTTVAWRAGLPDAVILLDDSCRENFIRGEKPAAQHELHGRPGSYLVCGEITLEHGRPETWHIVLDTNVDHAGVATLERVVAAKNSGETIEKDLRVSRERLRRFLASADALQCGGDDVAAAHHVSNTLFNIARGGVLAHQYEVERDDFARFLAVRNHPVAARHKAWLDELPSRVSTTALEERAVATGDPHLARLVAEYLPLVFSRRHGDPSRPWNRFAINIENSDGSPRYAYEGNWRDIFQNWEALGRSFPEIIEPMIEKFLNASTADGFNPYRITQDGIEWEVPDPSHPWSSIGYWGDHQIVYLLRLLEMSLAHHPGRIAGMISRRAFTYVDVPYRLVSYQRIVMNPRATIEFDAERDRAARERMAATGTDGRLLQADGNPLLVTMAEKLLVPILAKLSNLVPGGGIWMNTGRPEWNDANNALVGNGVSVVTACHLHRHLEVCAELFATSGETQFEICSHVAHWLGELSATVKCAGTSMDDRERRVFLDACGEAFSRYREQLYAGGPGSSVTVRVDDIVAFLRDSSRLIRATTQDNRRPDGLYHAYNVLHLANSAASLSRLPLMLEGQVAVLASGVLDAESSIALLDALRASDLYRDDQRSYLLYPDQQMPKFMQINHVPEAILRDAPTLARRIASGDTRVVTRDTDGILRFNADLHNEEALRTRVDDGIPPGEQRAILAAYESVFQHTAFTGRSGRMYRYEGIGCIYWHMVAKLWLAVLEATERAVATGASTGVINSLRAHADDIRAGLGFTRTVAEFGAFPLDAYSHTPSFVGASQPGMTGQVKEEILARWIELGVRIEDGCLTFEPARVHSREFLTGSRDFPYLDQQGEERALALKPDELVFTYCQVPVVYGPAAESSVIIEYHDGRTGTRAGTSLSREASDLIFGRTGAIRRITVQFRRP